MDCSLNWTLEKRQSTKLFELERKPFMRTRLWYKDSVYNSFWGMGLIFLSSPPCNNSELRCNIFQDKWKFIWKKKVIFFFLQRCFLSVPVTSSLSVLQRSFQDPVIQLMEFFAKAVNYFRKNTQPQISHSGLDMPLIYSAGHLHVIRSSVPCYLGRD